LERNTLIDQDIDYKTLIHALFDNLPQVFWLASVKETNKIEYLSPAFEGITGIKREDIYRNYLLWFDLIHEEDKKVMVDKSEKFGKGKEEYQETYRIVRKDGTIRWIQEKGFWIRNEKGEIEKLAGISEDITEKRNAEETLKESQAKLESIFKATPVGIGVVLNRVFVIVNDYLCDMVGYSKEELVGNSSRMIYPTEEEYEYVGREKYSLIEKYGVGSVETKFKKKDGAIINVLLSSSMIDRNNPSKGTIFTVLDITDRKKYEAQINNLNDNLKLLNKILRHDIANDLTIISIALEMINTENKDMKDKAFTAIQRSTELIEKIRALESTISARTDLKPIRAGDMAHSMKRIYSNVKINVNGDCDVIADEALASVIDNIISNAITHGKTNRIDIEITSRNNSCEIKIIDYGKGIPNDIKERIFDESFSHGPERGTGIGLFIAKKTIERYGGAVTVTDTLPNGATFVITLRNAE